jgi:hypothetical protein
MSLLKHLPKPEIIHTHFMDVKSEGVPPYMVVISILIILVLCGIISSVKWFFRSYSKYGDDFYADEDKPVK